MGVVPVRFSSVQSQKVIRQREGEARGHAFRGLNTFNVNVYHIQRQKSLGFTHSTSTCILKEKVFSCLNTCWRWMCKTRGFLTLNVINIDVACNKSNVDCNGPSFEHSQMQRRRTWHKYVRNTTSKHLSLNSSLSVGSFRPSGAIDEYFSFSIWIYSNFLFWNGLRKEHIRISRWDF